MRREGGGGGGGGVADDAGGTEHFKRFFLWSFRAVKQTK